MCTAQYNSALYVPQTGNISHVSIMFYSVTATDKLALGQEARMTAVFRNPLPVKMSDVTLNIESDELLNGTGNKLSLCFCCLIGIAIITPQSLTWTAVWFVRKKNAKVLNHRLKHLSMNFVTAVCTDLIIRLHTRAWVRG